MGQCSTLQEQISDGHFPTLSVLYYLQGYSRRQLSTLVDRARRDAPIEYIQALGGEPDGDWFKLSGSDDVINSVISKTRELDGYVFNLHVRD
jgi:hypothetical protein